MEKIDLTRRGRLEIADVRQLGADVHKAFGYLEFIPVFCFQEDYMRKIRMTGFSPHFEQVPDNAETPLYEIIINNGNIEIAKK